MPAAFSVRWQTLCLGCPNPLRPPSPGHLLSLRSDCGRGLFLCVAPKGSWLEIRGLPDGIERDLVPTLRLIGMFAAALLPFLAGELPLKVARPIP